MREQIAGLYFDRRIKTVGFLVIIKWFTVGSAIEIAWKDEEDLPVEFVTTTKYLKKLCESVCFQRHYIESAAGWKDF